mgnify:CR=1 FL=1|tara:strand:+ start:878 stop:1144 length:267 start_codon:yes stop_codon:yes gene_type:complete
MCDNAGPWYEIEGPSANDVRKDIFKKIKNGQFFEVEIAEITDMRLEQILLINIPDTKTDFGSWRGYATFGLDSNIVTKIKSDIRQIMS